MNAAPTKNEILTGHAKLRVGFMAVEGGLDREAEVKVHLLRVSEYPKLLEALDDELAQAALYTKESREWCDNLAPDSLEAVVAEGERLNGDFFARWVRRRTDRVARLLPGAQDAMQAAISRTLSQTLPSPPG